MSGGERPSLPRRLAARPESWLLALMAGAGTRLYALGHLAPRRSADAQSYEWLWELMSATDTLQSLRTFGYPIFLRIWSGVADDYTALPTFQLLLYFLAVGLFWRALASYSGSPWLALAAAVPLLSSSLLPFVRFVQPELMAPTMAIVTMALLFWLARRPDSKLLWLGLVFATLATYHLRPIYLPIAVMVPLLGIALRAWSESRRNRRLRRFALGLIAASVLPVLAYCGLRWVAVGEFAIVNLLGYELAGITSCFLDEEIAAELPEEHRELGQRILRQRRLRKWGTYGPESVSLRYFKQYGKNQWLIAEPFARRIVIRERQAHRESFGENSLPTSPLESWQLEHSDRPPLAGDLARAINDRLGAYGKWLIRRQPRLLRKWVSDGFVYGLERAATFGWIRWPLLALAASLPVLWLARRRGRIAPADRSLELAAIGGLFVLGLGFFLGKLALMSLVSWPWDRYLFGANLFLPSALSAALFALWSHVFRTPS